MCNTQRTSKQVVSESTGQYRESVLDSVLSKKPQLSVRMGLADLVSLTPFCTAYLFNLPFQMNTVVLRKKNMSTYVTSTTFIKRAKVKASRVFSFKTEYVTEERLLLSLEVSM